jgi:hypothetical protein
MMTSPKSMTSKEDPSCFTGHGLDRLPRRSDKKPPLDLGGTTTSVTLHPSSVKPIPPLSNLDTNTTYPGETSLPDTLFKQLESLDIGSVSPSLDSPNFTKPHQSRHEPIPPDDVEMGQLTNDSISLSKSRTFETQVTQSNGGSCIMDLGNSEERDLDEGIRDDEWSERDEMRDILGTLKEEEEEEERGRNFTTQRGFGLGNLKIRKNQRTKSQSSSSSPTPSESSFTSTSTQTSIDETPSETSQDHSHKAALARLTHQCNQVEGSVAYQKFKIKKERSKSRGDSRLRNYELAIDHDLERRKQESELDSMLRDRLKERRQGKFGGSFGDQIQWRPVI